jgi:hypothetical protein
MYQRLASSSSEFSLVLAATWGIIRKGRGRGRGEEEKEGGIWQKQTKISPLEKESKIN